MSQEHLAELIGKRRHHVSDWEQGKHEPKPATLARIAEETGQTLAFFYTDHSDDGAGGK